MADIRVKDLNEASVPGADYYLLTDSATDGVKKVKTTNVVKPVDIGAGATASPLSQFAATTSAQLASVISDETGSGALVFATSPTLVTPTLGAASATSINKVTITQPLTGSTITIPDGVTVTGPAATDTLVGRATTDTLTNKTISGTSNTLSNIGNSSLTNSSITIAGHSVALGGSQALAAADLLNGVTGTGAVVLASAPVLTNPVVGTQTAGDNSTKAASTAFVQNAVTGATAGVSSLNGQTGALVLNVPPLGRLTLASGVPVMSTSQANKTTVYYTPYAGNIVPIYDGTNMIPTVFTELSQATTDATKSPAAVAASKVYDLFVWNDAGTIRCTRGPAWTNSTTRGYTLTMVGGILLNTSAITNGPGASRGTWVGTIASNSSSQIDYIFGAAGSGGVAAVLNVWNAYNRVDVATSVVDSGTGYAYTTATIRQARASTGNQISFVTGAQEDGAFSTCAMNANSAAVNAFVRLGIGLDTITAFSNVLAFYLYPVSGVSTTQRSDYTFTPSIGTHVVASLEQGDGTNANTFDSNNNATLTLRYKM